MPWLAVPHDDAARRLSLSELLTAKGIPYLSFVSPDLKTHIPHGRQIVETSDGVDFPWFAERRHIWPVFDMRIRQDKKPFFVSMIQQGLLERYVISLSVSPAPFLVFCIQHTTFFRAPASIY